MLIIFVASPDVDFENFAFGCGVFFLSDVVGIDLNHALANLFSVSDVIGNGICDMFMWLVNYLPNAPSFF